MRTWPSRSRESSTSTCGTRWRTGTPTRQPVAPEGSPNVLIVLYDDTGMAAWSPYGGRIEMPTMQRLADEGLTYTQWHTTALCSPDPVLPPDRSQPPPERLRLHRRGGRPASPASNGRIPMENAFLAEVLRERGYNTYWIGKNHNVPSEDWDMGGSKADWPLARGFDRFYGFIGGETNQWYPDLVDDNHFVDQPYAARGRLPPLEGPGRQGAPLHRATASSPPRQALVHVLLPRREPRAAPRARRSTSTSTRASSTTATRPTASGCCRG